MPHKGITDEVKQSLTAAGSYRALTARERSLRYHPSGLLPSGEAGFAFIFQSGIDPNTKSLVRSFNLNYPSPGGDVSSGLPIMEVAGVSEFQGVYPTYPSGALHWSPIEAQTGIMHPLELDTPFSNSKETKDLLDRAGITDFTIFNNYVHYYGRG